MPGTPRIVFAGSARARPTRCSGTRVRVPTPWSTGADQSRCAPRRRVSALRRSSPTRRPGPDPGSPGTGASRCPPGRRRAQAFGDHGHDQPAAHCSQGRIEQLKTFEREYRTRPQDLSRISLEELQQRDSAAPVESVYPAEQQNAGGYPPATGLTGRRGKAYIVLALALGATCRIRPAGSGTCHRHGLARHQLHRRVLGGSGLPDGRRGPGSARRAPARKRRQMVGELPRPGGVQGRPLADDSRSGDGRSIPAAPRSVSRPASSVVRRDRAPCPRCRPGHRPCRLRHPPGMTRSPRVPGRLSASKAGRARIRGTGVGAGNASTQRLRAPGRTFRRGDRSNRDSLGYGAGQAAGGRGLLTARGPPVPPVSRPAGGYDDYLRSVGGLPETLRSDLRRRSGPHQEIQAHSVRSRAAPEPWTGRVAVRVHHSSLVSVQAATGPQAQFGAVAGTECRLPGDPAALDPVRSARPAGTDRRRSIPVRRRRSPAVAIRSTARSQMASGT